MQLIYLFGLIAFINCFFYFLYLKFSFSKSNQKTKSQNLPISLLISSKNEAENLKNHIPLWLSQNHPDFEIILINDASVDETLDVMEEFANCDSRIKVVDVKNNEAFWGSKKYALTLGIKKAKNEHMIFTDADCKPASDDWLSIMAGQFSDSKQLVIGYSPYIKTKGFLNRLIRYETLITAVQYFSYAKIGLPYMGVGRNLGYTAHLYYENRGFINHIKIASGDDDLFVNETANSKNTALCIHPKAFTYSIPEKTLKDWIKQKRRHYTTAKFYKPIHKILLGLNSFSVLFFWILVPFVLLSSYWKYGLIIILFRFLIQYLIIGKIGRKLKEKSLIYFIPFWELILIIFQILIFISGQKQNSTQWK